MTTKDELGRDAPEFFIGYTPPLPPRLARFSTHVVIGLACGVVVWAAALASGHVPLAAGTFEFGHPQRFVGTIVEHPHPALQLDDPREADWLLLVSPGKHGADPLIHGLDGRRATVSGTRIRRGGHTMVEVDSVSLVPDDAAESMVRLAEPAAAGLVHVRGEIVDSKCFLGVMVPGSGKTHKDCASLCLRGGIPPALYVEDLAGRSAALLLTGPSGESISAQALRGAGEITDMTGILERRGGWLLLKTDPASWRPVTRQDIEP